MAEEQAKQDARIPVLLIIGLIILGYSWFSPEFKRQASVYHLVPAASDLQMGQAKLLRISQDQADQGQLPTGTLVITPDLPCGTVPPELTALFNLPLPINQADQESLMLLPRIGTKLSERIIAFRNAQGPITGPEDFIRIKGIGPKLTARLTPLLCFAFTEAEI
ncbi:ComEA family DNA-binding protein [Candidatus Electrothrix sp.]|uniref:ComEA family DNA-binding protein n=1 Tax=Candidatus Electrothrix sp. TaxID=2170559 RepID=UPI0040577E9F